MNMKLIFGLLSIPNILLTITGWNMHQSGNELGATFFSAGFIMLILIFFCALVWVTDRCLTFKKNFSQNDFLYLGKDIYNNET